MEKNLVFDKKHCKIEMDESNGILYTKWSGFIQLDQAKEGSEFMTKYIKENGVKLHLSDHLDLKVVTEELKDYLTKEWFPAVERVGLRKVSALVSKNIYTRSSVDDINSRVQLGNLTIENFNTVKDCEDWLLK
ncbi:MAG: hypothetical protein ABJF04_08955 [Reichenbachiella sp.]|uniref:hypothetical protein n=1 Tax=Reichenbachiella sp. TaxID=2184521 RepID=UPI0032667632